MNNIIYDNDIITPKDHIWNYYNNFTKKLNERDCIKFALFCAKYVNPNTKESNYCIELVEKWLKDKKSVSIQELHAASNASFYAYVVNAASYAIYTAYSASDAAYPAAYTAYSVYYYATDFAVFAAYTAYYAYYANIAVTAKMNKYLQILLRKTKQFQNNKILEQISKTDIDKLELVDWNMITDIIQEEYNIVHEFEYEDIFSRRCLIELLRREYT